MHYDSKAKKQGAKKKQECKAAHYGKIPKENESATVWEFHKYYCYFEH